MATQMIHLRSFTFISKQGQTVAFKGPKEPIMVPDSIVQDAMAAGAAVFDPKDLPETEEPPKTQKEKAEEAPIGDDRVEQIKGALKHLKQKNLHTTFDSTGIPKLSSISKAAGFDVTDDERISLWPEVKHADD